MNYWIVADICSDLPKTYVYAQERLTLMPMNYTMAGKEYSYRVGDENRSDEFYQRIRGGEKATTSQIGISEYFDVCSSRSPMAAKVFCACRCQAVFQVLSGAHYPLASRFLHKSRRRRCRW